MTFAHKIVARTSFRITVSPIVALEASVSAAGVGLSGRRDRGKQHCRTWDGLPFLTFPINNPVMWQSWLFSEEWRAPANETIVSSYFCWEFATPSFVSVPYFLRVLNAENWKISADTWQSLVFWRSCEKWSAHNGDTFVPSHQDEAMIDLNAYFSTSFILSSHWRRLVRDIGYASNCSTLSSAWIETLKYSSCKIFILYNCETSGPCILSPNLNILLKDRMNSRRWWSVSVSKKSKPRFLIRVAPLPSLEKSK